MARLSSGALGSVLVIALLVPVAKAQPDAVDPPPKGPADVMGRAKDQAEQRRQDQRARSMDGHPEVGPGVRRALGGGRPLSSAEPSPEVGAGAIRVSVVDERGEPVPEALVLIGVLGQAGNRDKVQGRTDQSGTTTFTELATGSEQAYRVTVPHDGATYGSTPFRLPPDRGYSVRITQLPTTSDAAKLLLSQGRTMLELKSERLHVVQQYQLMNLGERTYVFPDDGLLVELPEGFTAFQSQEVMTDQRTARDDEGFRLHGSLPPGQVTLTWGFDLPIEGSELSFSFPVPWPVFRYQLMAEAAASMSLEVDGMPAPTQHEHEGGRLLLTQVQRTPSDAPIERIRVTLRGIPGPGPMRWVALGGMLVLLAAGLLLATRGTGSAGRKAGMRERRKRELLDEAAEIERAHAAGEIGPRYRQRRMDAVTAELAVLLREDSIAEARAPAQRRPGDAGVTPQT